MVFGFFFSFTMNYEVILFVSGTSLCSMAMTCCVLSSYQFEKWGKMGLCLSLILLSTTERKHMCRVFCQGIFCKQTAVVNFGEGFWFITSHDSAYFYFLESYFLTHISFDSFIIFYDFSTFFSIKSKYHYNSTCHK